jgi:hypothetical protein
MIISHGAGQGRRVLLADANPAIGALPVATLDPLAEPAPSTESTGLAWLRPLGTVPAKPDSVPGGQTQQRQGRYPR